MRCEDQRNIDQVSHRLPAPCLSLPFLPSGTGESCGYGYARTAAPRPVNGESCMRFDANGGRGADRSTGVSSCKDDVRNGLLPSRCGEGGAWCVAVAVVVVVDGSAARICHFGVANTEPTLAPTRIPRDGVDVGSKGEMVSSES